MKGLFLVNFGDMNFGQIVLWFFIYSFLGWCMECCVIRKELGYWENRGFSKLPFCVIYGFGCLIAFTVFAPISNNMPALFFIGAIAATAFEYLTAMVMLRLFGELWWNYDHKRFNYKGILCLESTLGWGLICVLLFMVVNIRIKAMVMAIDPRIVRVLSTVLLVTYTVDFIIQFYHSRREKKNAVSKCS